jgi:hypothetical protein
MKTQKENDALDQNEFQKIMTKVANLFLSSPCRYFDCKDVGVERKRA